MKLVIISHTTHYIKNNVVVGWSPTVREINYLKAIADEIVHVAPLSDENDPGFGESYIDGVRFVPMPVVGGDGLLKKISILLRLPQIIWIVLRELRGADFFQFRAPTGIGTYIIPLLLVVPTKGWFKFAGNWNAKEYPLSYKFQRWVLTHLTKRKVTVNGVWQNQPKHVLSFDNPCLTADEVKLGAVASGKKEFNDKLSVLFVGRLEHAKGMDLIVGMFQRLKDKTSIERVVFIGDGPSHQYETALSGSVPVTFAGNMTRAEINKYYAQAHIFILPSYSEGFPKVLAESGAFGCVPAISNVSAIGQYINDSNGLLFDTFEVELMTSQLEKLLSDRPGLKIKSFNMTRLAEKFSYDVYNARIRNEVMYA